MAFSIFQFWITYISLFPLPSSINPFLPFSTPLKFSQNFYNPYFHFTNIHIQITVENPKSLAKPHYYQTQLSNLLDAAKNPALKLPWAVAYILSTNPPKPSYQHHHSSLAWKNSAQTIRHHTFRVQRVQIVLKNPAVRSKQHPRSSGESSRFSSWAA